MIEIDGNIVSEDILTEYFACDITKCHGECCVEGNAGAPLDVDEVDILDEEYENYRPYMTEEGIASVEKNGFMVIDEDGDYTTPLVNDRECAYSYKDGEVTLCAIEKAYNEGKCSFRKPISCHLYPIRLVRFSNGMYGLNYHRWDVCQSACQMGRKFRIPVYKAVKDAIIARFGEDFYNKLEVASDLLKKQ